MTTEIKVPVLPESVADASIATWHVKVGDTVARDQNLVDIETDKVVLKLLLLKTVLLLKLLHEEGATVLGEQVIAKLVQADGAAQLRKSGSSAPAPAGETKSVEIKVPVLPESVADATIATWHVQEGEAVSRDQNLS